MAEFERRLVDLYSSILAAQVSVLEYCDKSLLSKTNLSLSDRLLMINLESIPRAAYGTDVLQQTMREVEAKDALCDKAKEMIDEEIAYQRDFDVLLKWIHEEDPMDIHLSMCERTHTTEDYQSCGSWLFDMLEFKIWDSSQSGCLWICGTGMNG